MPSETSVERLSTEQRSSHSCYDNIDQKGKKPQSLVGMLVDGEKPQGEEADLGQGERSYYPNLL